MNGGPGPGGTLLLVVAGGAVLIALFPLGMSHRIRHDARRTECAERLRTLQQLAAVRQSMGSCRASLPAGSARWLSIQRAPAALVGPADLPLFFCPFTGHAVGPGATDFRGPRTRRKGWGGPDPVGADLEGNHPPCCPINVVLNDGSLRECPADDPRTLALRDELSP